MAKKRKTAPLGMLFWLAIILLIGVVFLYNRSNIDRVLESTNIVEVIRQRLGNRNEPAEPTITTVVQQPEEQPEEVPGEGSQATSDPSISEEQQSPPTANSDEPAEHRSRTSVIYFIRLTDEGHIQPERVLRNVSYSENPLTKTLQTLLHGPTRQELDSGLLNLIPQHVILLSAAIDSRVAYLNFNEAFLFNPMGIEGAVAQLQQVVYSATEFSTITSVQILIEGDKKEYMGTEGIYIGSPIGRDAFG